MRLIWLLILFSFQLLYFPINRIMEEGVVLATPWDALIPLWPVWVIPYLLSLVWWTGCFIWAAWKMDDSRYRAFVVSVITVTLASYVVYILYPTYVVRPALSGNDWLTEIVRGLYAADRVNNAFPSGHTYNTVLITFFWWRWYPRQRWLWLAIAIIILFSTLFTRQHNLPDLLGGVVFAWLGYRFGLWWANRGLEGV
jgi:membrane-associated phospholipid phosphatase